MILCIVRRAALFALVCLTFFATTWVASGGALDVLQQNSYPTRIAQGPNGQICVTDGRVGSVFIYDRDLNLTGEIKGIKDPMGVAVDRQGKIYVGDSGNKNVRIYTQNGLLHAIIGRGILGMPNDMSIDFDGNLYVVDSTKHRVSIFNSGHHVRTIGSAGTGDGQFRFPTAVTIAYQLGAGNQPTGEVFVADQGNFRVQVFDMAGNFKRKFGAQIKKEVISYDAQGRFNKVRSLQLDDLYRVHAVDCYANSVQILDSDTGAYIAKYGDSFSPFGTSSGTLKTPLDILINETGKVAVANSRGSLVQFIYTNTDATVSLSNYDVAESTPTGTVVGAFSVSPDPGGNTFVLVPGYGDTDNVSFAVQGSNLVTAAVLDYETQNSFSIRAKAVNGNSMNLVYADELTVTATDVPEGPTGLTLYEPYIAESQPTNTLVGYFMPVDDDMGDTFTYALVPGVGDSGNWAFSVTGSNLMTEAVFDYDATNSYSIRASVQDGGGESYTNVINVSVVPLNNLGDPDRDNDGISDWWEYAYTASVTGLVATADYDADGSDNISEWVALTDPLWDGDVFHVSKCDASAAGNYPVLRWPGVSNRVYDIEWMTNLVTDTFVPLATNLPATPPDNVYTDTVHGSVDVIFYRIRARIPSP